LQAAGFAASSIEGVLAEAIFTPLVPGKAIGKLHLFPKDLSAVNRRDVVVLKEPSDKLPLVAAFITVGSLNETSALALRLREAGSPVARVLDAESEGVDKRQVQRDLDAVADEKSGGDMSPPEPEAETEQPTEPAPAPKPAAAPKVEPPTVTGRDGKTYPNARAADPEDDADAVLDDDETPVPAKLREAFGETNLFRRAAVALQRAAVALEEVEHSVAYALADRQAAASGTGDRRVYSTACRTAEKRMLGMRPARVCCGDGCEKCGGKGYLSAEEVQ
jgi:hypothetical protein